MAGPAKEVGLSEGTPNVALLRRGSLRNLVAHVPYPHPPKRTYLYRGEINEDGSSPVLCDGVKKPLTGSLP